MSKAWKFLFRQRSQGKSYDEFISQGVDLTAIRNNTKVRALETQTKWKLKKTTTGYGLSIETGRNWGLFISKAIKENEPEICS